MNELTQARGCGRSFCLALPVMISSARSYFFLKDATRGRAFNTPFHQRVKIISILAPVADKSGENGAVFDFFRIARGAIRMLVTAEREKYINPPIMHKYSSDILQTLLMHF